MDFRKARGRGAIVLRECRFARRSNGAVRAIQSTSTDERSGNIRVLSVEFAVPWWLRKPNRAVIIAIYGLVLRARTNVHRQTVVVFVILQMGVAYTATALGYNGKATALATLSGWLLLLLLLGRAGRPRLVVSAIAMFALAGIFGYRATSDWMHRKPEGSRDIDVEFFTVADDVA
jgi:hypothetical protein